MLDKPTNTCIASLAALKYFFVNTKGRLIRLLMISMPPTEPRPKTAMYTNAASAEGIVAKTKIINAALPAIPCTMPTKNGRAPE